MRAINWRIWVCTTVICAIIITSLNWLLKQPALFNIIGDENTWLPIIADIIIAVASIVVAYRLQLKYNIHQQQLLEMNEMYKALCSKIDDIYEALNVYRKFHAFILTLDSDKDIRSLFSDITDVQQNIDNKIHLFKEMLNDIKSKEEACKYIETVTKIAESYQIVLSGLLKTINDWNDLQNSIYRPSNNMLNLLTVEQTAKYITLEQKCKSFLREQKNKFLALYDAQQNNIKIMMDTLYNNSIELKNAEQKMIDLHKQKYGLYNGS